MKPARTAATLAVVLTALPAHAAPERDTVQRPLHDYSPLWINPVFQTEGENKKPNEDDVPEAVRRRVPVPSKATATLTELEARVRALEAEVKGLKEALRDATDPEEEQEETPDAPANLPRLSSQQALLRLERLTADEAKQSDLKVKRRKILPNIEGRNVHRARIETEMTGREEEIYQWLHRLHSPSEFRALTNLTLRPSRADQESVDATALVEQCYLPANIDAAAQDAKEELRPLIEPAHYPLELLLQVVQASPEGLLLVYSEIANSVDGDQKLSRFIRVQGEAEELAQVVAFKEALGKSAGLKAYRWHFPAPVEDSKKGPWQFLYDAVFDPE